MRLAWLTDIHLNFVEREARREFWRGVGRQADAVAISGDIGESPNVAGYMHEWDEILAKPVYFVLGNHDFYRGSIDETRRCIAADAGQSDRSIYLTAGGVEELTPDTAIIGHDGWPDGRFGNYWGTDVLLNDHLLIDEMSRWYQYHNLDRKGLRGTLFELAGEAATHVERCLTDAVTSYRHVVAVTHIPPFREAAWYEGKVSNDEWLPYFSSKVMGEAMTRVMESHPRSDLLVLCGHTHGGGELQVLDNLRVLTGHARYREPVIQHVFDLV